MKSRLFILAAIVLTAANLRPAITGVGPLIASIARGTGLPLGLAGLVTTLPLIAFGIISPIAPRLALRFGLERTLAGGLVVLAVGTLLRSLGSEAALLIGMFLVGGGVAIDNVLLPSLVKRSFPTQIGMMTGVYVTVMNVFAGLGSGLSVPLARVAHWGWRGSLGIWVVLALLALLVWLPQLNQRHVPDWAAPRTFWRSKTAWQITLFMGLQSLLFYVSIAWLPTLLHDRGFSLSVSGWLISMVQIVSLPGTFLMPIWAQRRRTQHGLVLGTGALFLIGYLGLWLTSGRIWSVVWIIFVGFGSGVSISLALAFFGLRTHNYQSAAQISGMAQSVGYLLAAIGPLAVGYLHAATHQWTAPLVLLAVGSALMTWTGLGAARDVYIDADVPPMPAPK